VVFELIGHNDPHGITKTGSPWQVFAAVVAIIYNQVKLRPNEIYALYFTAHEPSRRKLYHAMSQKLPRTLGWEYDEEWSKYETRINPESQKFILVNPKHKNDIDTNEIEDDLYRKQTESLA